MNEVFTGNFTQQEPLPDAAIAAALAVMQHGRLHRYNLADGELGETALLEQEFASKTGAEYALAVASGGYGLACALRAVGAGPGDLVLTNGFTLAPVPGAIASIGAEPVLVEIDHNLCIDLKDLAEKQSISGAKTLMLSHMRGHICDMEALMDWADGAGVRVIEDCAHTMGASWNEKPSGRFGAIGCFSTQTYKHINSGEGGIIVTDDADLMARMVALSGSYMLYDRHIAGPDPSHYRDIALSTPNISGRMDNLRAAILRPQLAQLEEQIKRWNALYFSIETGLRGMSDIVLIKRPMQEHFVGSSFQFRLPQWGASRIETFVRACEKRGVVLKWFGQDSPSGYTSTYRDWAYLKRTDLPNTDDILAGLLDLRLPLSFSTDDCAQISRIIVQEVERG